MRRRLVLLLRQLVIARETDFALVAQNGEPVGLKVVVGHLGLLRAAHLHQRLTHHFPPLLPLGCWV